MISSKSLLATISLLLAVIGNNHASAADQTSTDPQDQLPKSDGKPADMTKPVQVFILTGQSNMVGLGKVAGGDGSLENAVKNKSKYSYLVNDTGNWSERMDVRFVRFMSGKGPLNNEWMAVKGVKMGPEYGIGHYAGYKDRPDSWAVDKAKGTATEPTQWLDKNGKPIDWYAGKQYDDDTADAKKVLADIGTYYPSVTKCEVAGFFFWQGEKDGGNAAHASKYEENLVRFIKQLRTDFAAPNAKFVLATLGEAIKGSDGNGGKILEAQLAVDGTNGKYPEFKGNVATVYSNPLSLGGSGNSHYNGNAETYMNVGEAMGNAMAEMLNEAP